MTEGVDPGGNLADQIAALSPAKRALLELRLREKRTQDGAKGPGGSPVPLRASGGPAPLSFAQQRLWFLDQLEPGSALYTVPCRAWLTGSLDVDALRRALQTVIERHESLRTVFPAVDGEPSQVILRSVACDLPVVDLRGLPASERESEVERRITLDAREPFDLARGPLLRPRLLRLGQEEHALLLTIHHIVSDGWSLSVLFRELGTLYDVFVQGRPSPLPELPIQYADYAVWQRERLQGALLEREVAYWKKQFPRTPAPLWLPTDRPRPAAPSHRGARVRFELTRALVERLSALGLHEGATLFMTLLGAFQTLLARYTGRDDIVVGSPIAGRIRPETEGLIGFFINTLALRTDLSGDPTFGELLGRVREVALGAFSHQELPFEKVVQELQPERSLAHSPLFQVMFALQNVPRSERRLTGLSLRHIELDKGTAKFDLGLTLSEHPAGLRGALSYDTDLFDQSTIRRMATHYRTLLEGIAADPGRRISRLPLLSDEERRQLLVEWNTTDAACPQGRCLHELFEEQAARSPDAVAVESERGALTYRDLNRRANRLARHLTTLGVGPEIRVGLCADRSPELMVALLAVLKAGGAYLPMDPAQPVERLSLLLADADVHVLIARTELLPAGLLDRLPETLREVLPIGGEGEGVTMGEDDNPQSGAGPANAAYVLYTSGSTGVPKGVVVPHQAVVNLSWAASREYCLAPGDRVLHAAGLTSDFSVEEIFPAWFSGATVVLWDPGPTPMGADFLDLLATRGVGIVLLPTAFWHAWVDEMSRSGGRPPSSLRVVSVGGEKVQPAAYARWQALNTGHIRWFNTYGPTETTVEATLHEPRVSGGERNSGADLPIGRPIANARVYVLDRHMEPVPAGVTGELYVGGSGLARGYLHRPGLTAERFLPDPFGPVPGGRLYRTGDSGRYRTDGTLEFIDRLDRQVKIRGHRVELGEVEAALAAHPGVSGCVVLLREDVSGDRRLVGYVAPAGADPLSVRELRAFLAQRLPEPMIPTAILVLAQLPLGPGGKVDSRLLPPPEAIRPDLDEGFEPPRTPLETSIAAVWATVLRVERVGIHDNFFSLGGHSLLATQAISRMRTACGVDLPLRALFESPTIAGLARRAVAAPPAEAPPPLLRLSRERDGGAGLTR